MPDSIRPKQIPWTSVDVIHPELLHVKHRVYDPSGLKCTQPVMEPESAEYGAYIFEVNGLSIRFRVAKSTPTKTGQFVTLWKRIGNGPIQPYDFSDPVDFFIVNTSKNGCRGQFVFPKTVLSRQGVFSINGQGGKRAIRVYSPWDSCMSLQAQKTKKWQSEYFLEIPKNGKIDIERARMLYQKR